MVNHVKKINFRLIYFIFLFLLYRQCFEIYDLSLNLAMYIIFLFIYFSYYIFNVLNFDVRFKAKDFVYSVLINLFFIGIFYFFYKEIEVLYVFLEYTLFQILLSWILHSHRKNKVNVLTIGDAEQCEIIRKILENSENYSLKGYIAEKKFEINLNYLGEIKELNSIIEKKAIESIIFSKNSYIKKNSDLLVKVKLKGIKAVDYLSFLEEFDGKIDSDKIDSMWVLMTNSFNNSANTLNKRIKRTMDLFLAVFLSVLSIPFIVFTYFLVKCDIGFKYIFLNPRKILENPAFFQQDRIGYRGNLFKIIKFRSMKIHDPDKFSKYASENDSRITRIGKFIRKTRLDELPQLINVIRGEMSFVGPRPEWDKLGKKYEEEIKNYTLRYAVQPGITGWAQTVYRYGASVDDAKIKLEYDLYYIKNQSFILDLIILFKTAKTVLFREGM